MAHTGKVNALGTRPALLHGLGHFGGEQIGLGPSQQQGGSLDLVVQMPQQGFALLSRLGGQGVHWLGQRGVVMQGPAAVGQGLEHGRAEGQPLGIGVRAKTG